MIFLYKSGYFRALKVLFVSLEIKKAPIINNFIVSPQKVEKWTIWAKESNKTLALWNIVAQLVIVYDETASSAINKES